MRAVSAVRHGRVTAWATLVLVLGCSGTPSTSTGGPSVEAQRPDSPSAPVAQPTAAPSPTPIAEPTATAGATATALAPTGTAIAPAASAAAPATAPATPAGASGGPPQPVLEAGHSEPSLVVDGAGHAHIAAARAGGVLYATNAGGTWTATGVSSPTGGDDPNARTDRQPSLAMDIDGSLALAFSRWGPEDTFGRLPEGILLARAEAGTSAWSEPVVLIDDPSGGHSPSLALNGGATHLAYVLGIGVDVVTEEMSFPVRYLTDVDDAVSDVEVSPNGTAPVLDLDRAGMAHLLFGDENGLLETDALWYASTMPDAGFDAEPIPGTTRYAAPHDLSIDPLGTVHVAWTRPGFTTAEDRYAALHQRWSGTWSDPETIALDATVRAVAADAHGHVHLVGSDLEGAWYATDRGGSFELTRLAGEPEVGADVAIDAFGRAHVVFAVGEGEESQLWYWIGEAP